MSTTNWIHYIPIVLSFLLSGTVGVFAWRHRQSPGIKTYFYITLAQMSWIFGYAFELASPSLAGKIFWDDIQFIGSMFTPLLFMVFAYEYTGQGKELSRRTRMALTAVPVLFLLLLFTNAVHGLVRTPTARTIPGEPFDALIYDFTPLMWVSFVYSYLTYLAATVLFIRNMFRQLRLFRVQTLIILIGFIFPFLGSIPGMAGVVISGQRDIAPYTFGIGNLILAWGLFRHSLFEITPIARDAVLEFMNDWVIVIDHQSRVVDINPAALSTMDITANQAISLPIAQLLADYPDLIRLLQNDQPVRADTAYTSPDGTSYILDTFLSPLYDQNNRLIGRLLVARDITQRRQAETALRQARDELDIRVQERTVELYAANVALRESEARQRALLDAIPELVFRIRRDGIFLDYHTPGREQLLVAPESFLGQPIQAVMPPNVADKTMQAVKHVLQTGQPAEFEYSLAVEEEVHYFDARMVVSGPDEVLTTVRDITSRKRGEVEREQLIRDLEARNAELERFMYTTSHDLKSPLITIGSFIGFLEKDALSGNVERVKADAAYINDALVRMRRLLDELLELSRVGRVINPAEAVSFDVIAREAIELVHERIEARGVVVRIASDLPVVCGDRARLVEVIQNLVDNACKFIGDQPHPQVEIGAQQEGDEPVFYVRDNGIGIDPQYHEKVFGLFDKLDPTSEGTGIGLALVKRIIETHGGKIWIESAGKGDGTTFCFTLNMERPS